MVVECLGEFHGFTRHDARLLVGCCRRAAERDGEELTSGDPFTLACDLAGSPLPFREYLPEYLTLMGAVTVP